MGYLLDTDWAIQALARQSPVVSILNRLASEHISISSVTIGEIYEGAFNSSNPEARLNIYRAFLEPYHVLNVDRPIAERFAELRAFLRRRGQIISDFDIVIAATALKYDLTLLTFNIRHLSRIPDLRLYQLS